MKKLALFLLLFLTFSIFSQELTGEQLLEKAIDYHDPNGNWKTFNGELFITMKTPEKSERKSHIKINLPKEYFYVKANRDSVTSEYTVKKNDCAIALNGNNNPSEVEKKEEQVKL